MPFYGIITLLIIYRTLIIMVIVIIDNYDTNINIFYNITMNYLYVIMIIDMIKI